VGEPLPIIEKIKYPFIRIAESVSPSYMQRRYLAELEEKGIIEHMEPIDKTPGESFTSRLKNTLLARFRKKGSPENDNDFE